MYVFGIVWYIKALYGIVRCRARPCETSPRPAMAYAQGIALSKLAPLYDIIYILGLFAVLYIILLIDCLGLTYQLKLEKYVAGHWTISVLVVSFLALSNH